MLAHGLLAKSEYADMFLHRSDMVKATLDRLDMMKHRLFDLTQDKNYPLGPPGPPMGSPWALGP